MLNRKSLARLLVDGRRRRKKRGGKAELARPSLGFRHIAIIGRGRVACNVAAINRPALGFVDNFNWKTRSWVFRKVSIFHWPLKKIGKKLLRSWMRFSNVGQISHGPGGSKQVYTLLDICLGISRLNRGFGKNHLALSKGRVRLWIRQLAGKRELKN